MVEVTRCKLKVTKVELQGENGQMVTLTAVYDPNPESENGRFFQYTPVAEVKLGVLNPAIDGFFELGQEYYVDFSKAPKPE